MSTWIMQGGGRWFDASNWNGGVPNGFGAIATFEATGTPGTRQIRIENLPLGLTVGRLEVAASSTVNYFFIGLAELAFSGPNPTLAVTGSGTTTFGRQLGIDLMSLTELSVALPTTRVDLLGPVTGSGAMILTGSGTVFLAGTNAYSFGTAINDFTTVLIGNSQAFGTGEVRFNSLGSTGDATTLRATETVTIANAMTHGSGMAVTLAAEAGDTLTLTGGYALSTVIAGSTDLHFGQAGVGTGTVTWAPSGVSGVGPLFVDAGTLKIGSDAAVAALSTTPSLTIADGATLLVDHAAKVGITTQVSGAGTLAVQSSSDVDLSGLTFTKWTGDITITGTAGNDTLKGSSQADTFMGGLGADTLIGGGGNDTFLDLGEDTGIDLVTGGTGRDTFVVSPSPILLPVFGSVTSTPGSPDRITDFEGGPTGDVLDLRGWLPTMFSGWDGTTNPFVSGHVRLVAGDGDGDGAADDVLVLGDLDGTAGSFLTPKTALVLMDRAVGDMVGANFLFHGDRTWSVPGENSAPVAVNDTATMAEDGALTVSAAAGVLANDTDVDSAVLTAALVTGPANGTLKLNSDGSYDYTPNANFNGSDSFTYQASDGTDLSNVATVTLTVTPVNDTPVGKADAYAVGYQTPLVVTKAAGVLANDTDVDGDALTAALVTGPAKGSLTFNTDGSFTYTPIAGVFGLDSFTYEASDGLSATSGPTTVTLTVASPPNPPNLIQGNDGNDPFLGGTRGRDEVRGLDGNDVIDGRQGDDIVEGGSGNDRMNGGEGDDIYIGGSGADQFRFDGRTISGSDTDTLRDLVFADGDTIAFVGFAAGTFVGVPGGNPLNVFGGGAGAILDSVADLVELAAASSRVTSGRLGTTDTLTLTITDGDGDVQVLRLDNFYAAYMTAGGLLGA